MVVYIDDEFKCHITDDGTMAAIETSFFDGKCDTFIEGYRYIPAGASWTRPDGVVFFGEMVSPWKPYNELKAAQAQYERERLADAENALAILLGGEV